MSNPLDQIRPNGGAASESTKVEQTRAVAEVAAAVHAAITFPRSEDRVREEMLKLCSNYTVAQRAFYEVPNRGSGLSVHIARELLNVWGNADSDVRELSRDDVAGQSEVVAVCWDKQRNVRTSRTFIVPHAKMVKKQRQEITDINEVYLNNQNIGARAVRECILATLPGWYVAEAEEKLRETLTRGNGLTIEQRREEAVAAFTSLRVTAAQLEQRVKRKYDQWQPEDIAELERVYISVTRDGIAITDFFPQEPVQLPTVTDG